MQIYDEAFNFNVFSWLRLFEYARSFLKHGNHVRRKKEGAVRMPRKRTIAGPGDTNLHPLGRTHASEPDQRVA